MKSFNLPVEYAIIVGGIIGLSMHSTSPGSGIAMFCFSNATSSRAAPPGMRPV
ncbi:hypothetical protein NKJ84_26635 [Mesorhizobium sp. M0048]|uniref:hypothetical protein n=1 Tax=Mesorhizobium sp. M0048 TaxID=2956860 RepID=UPI00333A2066